MTETKAHLDALVKSPGWLLLKAYAATEWGPAGCWRKVKAEAGLVPDPATIAQIDYANKAIGDLMNWPEHQIKRLTEKALREQAEPALGRGGQG